MWRAGELYVACLGCSSETIQRAGLIHTLRMRCFSLHYRAIGPSLLVTQNTGDDNFLSGYRFVFHYCNS